VKFDIFQKLYREIAHFSRELGWSLSIRRDKWSGSCLSPVLGQSEQFCEEFETGGRRKYTRCKRHLEKVAPNDPHTRHAAYTARAAADYAAQ